MTLCSEQKEKQTVSAGPADRFHLVSIICLILGSGTLLAYNAIVSCSTYFHHEFASQSSPDIMFVVVPIFSIPNLLFIVLMIPFGDRCSWSFKILGCFVVVAVIVFAIPLIVPFGANPFRLSLRWSYYVFLLFVAAIGVSSAILQCSVIAFCGLLLSKYLQTVMGGQAVSGILVSVLRIFSKLFLPSNASGSVCTPSLQSTRTQFETNRH